jgi:hypothetical protein
MRAKVSIFEFFENSEIIMLASARILWGLLLTFASAGVAAALQI